MATTTPAGLLCAFDDLDDPRRGTNIMHSLTGKSDILRNVRQNLLSGFDRILIVATDRQAHGKVERELARCGLLGLDKISISLQHNGLAECLAE